MNNFNYYAPTKVVFGKDTEKRRDSLVKEQGASSVLVLWRKERDCFWFD